MIIVGRISPPPIVQRHEKRALTLAWRGRFGVSPNPLVGAVLEKHGEVIGEGWHKQDGHAHAEVMALEDCHSRFGARSRELLKGATLYVNLEPCAHQGRTPPCAQALIDAGIARAVISLDDPYSQVAGRGRATLQKAGVEVVDGSMVQPAVLLNAGYLSRLRRARPWTVLKLGASLDGRTALKVGAGGWVTGAQARADVQCQRAMSDALLTGRGTVVADNPRLNVRASEMPASARKYLPNSTEMLRFVLDSNLKTAPSARMLGLGQTVIACAGTPPRVAQQALEATGAQVLSLPADSRGRVVLESVMQFLHEKSCNRLLAECGPSLAGSLLKERWVDEILLYQAPLILGSDAPPLWHLEGPAQMPQADFALVEQQRLGADIRLRYVRTEALRQLTETAGD